jgi:hypothetical protein
MRRTDPTRRRAVRRLTTAGVLLAALATSAGAQCPPPASTLAAYIMVVGTNGGGVADPAGRFTITIRNCLNQPMAGAQVEIDFSACPDMRPCQSQGPGITVTCANRTLRALTNGLGQATWDIVGAGRNNGAMFGAGANCAQYRVNGVILGRATVVILDQNGLLGSPGMGVTDISAFLADLGTGTYFGRSDYFSDGVIDVRDLSIMLTRFGTGQSAAGCSAAYCM